jgi:hypothetical protein
MYCRPFTDYVIVLLAIGPPTVCSQSTFPASSHPALEPRSRALSPWPARTELSEAESSPLFQGHPRRPSRIANRNAE